MGLDLLNPEWKIFENILTLELNQVIKLDFMFYLLNIMVMFYSENVIKGASLWQIVIHKYIVWCYKIYKTKNAIFCEA